MIDRLRQPRQEGELPASLFGTLVDEIKKHPQAELASAAFGAALFEVKKGKLVYDLEMLGKGFPQPIYEKGNFNPGDLRQVTKTVAFMRKVHALFGIVPRFEQELHQHDELLIDKKKSLWQMKAGLSHLKILGPIQGTILLAANTSNTDVYDFVVDAAEKNIVALEIEIVEFEVERVAIEKKSNTEAHMRNAQLLYDAFTNTFQTAIQYAQKKFPKRIISIPSTAPEIAASFIALLEGRGNEYVRADSPLTTLPEDLSFYFSEMKHVLDTPPLMALEYARRQVAAGIGLTHDQKNSSGQLRHDAHAFLLQEARGAIAHRILRISRQRAIEQGEYPVFLSEQEIIKCFNLMDQNEVR